MRLIELRDECSGLEAFVAVDHELFPIAAGGTRMLPDLDAREVARLARAMTWKFAACHVPYAGAKAGIAFAGGDRAAVLDAYKRALEPYGDIFVTSLDMGTFPADFLDEQEGPLPLWAQSHEGLGMDDLATGHGVKAAAETALAHLGRTLEGAAVAVEGFGKVGAGTARACERAGARIVGISTLDGLLADPDGIDVDELLALREHHGDRLVEHGPRPMRPREALFELDCDVLVPGARPDSITPNLAKRLRCAVVAPGANLPYARGAVDVLHRRGILAVPDFLSNSGGVHLYDKIGQDEEPKAALATIEAAVREAVSTALVTCVHLGITPYAAALREARDYLARTTAAPREMLDELFPAEAASEAKSSRVLWCSARVVSLKSRGSLRRR
jgi:glutamate dehydrogenase (NAD(P)+)